MIDVIIKPEESSEEDGLSVRKVIPNVEPATPPDIIVWSPPHPPRKIGSPIRKDFKRKGVATLRPAPAHTKKP